MAHDETHQLMSELLDVRQRFEGLTIIIIEHEMGVIERVTDRCIVLNYGRKICEGRFAEVAADPIVREAYLGRGA
jgi:branched-chain amino acid transport system ATP-binding protein